VAVLIGISDELGDRLGRNRWMYHHDEGCASDASDRRDTPPLTPYAYSRARGRYRFFRLEKNKPLVLPEPIEAVGAQLGVLDRMHDVAVAQEVLQRAGVHAVVGELEPAAMA
jgi:hypothetical protein